jgi:transitional endoplasmic reticulum ATPase
MSHFAQALNASRATVTQEMEEEYRAMETRLKAEAMIPQGMGFVSPGMVRPIRDSKHEP